MYITHCENANDIAYVCRPRMLRLQEMGIAKVATILKTNISLVDRFHAIAVEFVEGIFTGQRLNCSNVGNRLNGPLKQVENN